jgi:hypothetical protein
VTAEECHRPQRYCHAYGTFKRLSFLANVPSMVYKETRVPHDHPDRPCPPRSQVPLVRGDPGDDRLGGHDDLISAYRYSCNSIRAPKSLREAGEQSQIVRDSELSILSFGFSRRCGSQEQVLARTHALPNNPAHSGVLIPTRPIFNSFSQDTISRVLIGRETFRCCHFSPPSPSPCAF